MKNYFEQQKFNKFLFFLIFAILMLAPLLLYVLSSLDERSKEIFYVVLINSGVLTIIFYLLFVNATLVTNINKNQLLVYWKILKYRFFEKEIPFNEIKSYKLISYGFVGYGYRITSKYGIVFNARGNQGISFKLKNRKVYTIGTQKPDELLNFINNI